MSDSPDRCRICGSTGHATETLQAQAGICFSTRECRIKAQKLRRAIRRAGAPVVCITATCESYLAPGNESGLCLTHYRERKAASIPRCEWPECTRKLRLVRGEPNTTGYCGTHRPKFPKESARLANAELPEAYDLDDGSLIMDPIAIEIMVKGQRHVRLTRSERLECIRRMIRLGDGVREISSKMHMRPEDIRPFLQELGYEVIRDEHVTSRVSLVIVRIDRSRTKILEQEMPVSNRPAKPVPSAAAQRRSAALT